MAAEPHQGSTRKEVIGVVKGMVKLVNDLKGAWVESGSSYRHGGAVIPLRCVGLPLWLVPLFRSRNLRACDTPRLLAARLYAG
jgi:hypothetical protein